MTGTVIGIFCVAAFLLIIGIVLISGHGSFLIAGYNTMKPKEQEKIRQEKALPGNRDPYIACCRNLRRHGACRSVLYRSGHRYYRKDMCCINYSLMYCLDYIR